MTKYVRLSEDGQVTEVTISDYKEIQAQVGGIFCAPWEGRHLDGRASVFANDEAILIGMPINPFASFLMGQPIHGPILVGGPVDDEGNVTNVTGPVEMAVRLFAL